MKAYKLTKRKIRAALEVVKEGIGHEGDKRPGNRLSRNVLWATVWQEVLDLQAKQEGC